MHSRICTSVGCKLKRLRSLCCACVLGLAALQRCSVMSIEQEGNARIFPLSISSLVFYVFFLLFLDLSSSVHGQSLEPNVNSERWTTIIIITGNDAHAHIRTLSAGSRCVVVAVVVAHQSPMAKIFVVCVFFFGDLCSTRKILLQSHRGISVKY